MSEQKPKGYQPMPEGGYKLRLKESSLNEAKSGKGKYIKAVFEVMNGDHKDKVIYKNFIVDHTSEKAEEIGRQQLDKFLGAVNSSVDALEGNFEKVADFESFPFQAQVIINERNKYTDKNGNTVIPNDIKEFQKL